MAKNIVKVEFEIDSSHLELVEDITNEYKLSSNSKVIRVLLDYVSNDADTNQIFSRENKRCRFC